MILDGKALSALMREDLAKKIAASKAPELAVILVEGNDASEIYVSNKLKAAEKVGIKTTLHRLSQDSDTASICALIDKLNADINCNAILLQLPLPAQIDKDLLLSRIDPLKDVDGFHPINVGKMYLGLPCLAACTALGIIRLLTHYGVELRGRNVAMIGASNIVGKPTSLMLLSLGATVSVCHDLTGDIALFTKSADVVISATGMAGLIRADMIKKGAAVVDVGISRVLIDGKNRIVGDCDYEALLPIAGAISPVPGGVGPMTIAYLLENTYKAQQMQKQAEKNF